MRSLQSSRPFSQIWAASTAAVPLTTWPLSQTHLLGLNSKTGKNVAAAQPLPPRNAGGKAQFWGQLTFTMANHWPGAWLEQQQKCIYVHAEQTAAEQKALNTPLLTSKKRDINTLRAWPLYDLCDSNQKKSVVVQNPPPGKRSWEESFENKCISNVLTKLNFF